MPRISEAERYSKWTDRIHGSRKETELRIDKWKKYMRYYRLDLSPEEMGIEGDTVWINYLFAYARVILPSIYYRNPDISVTPRKETPREYANLIEKLLNYQVEEMDLESEAQKVCFDALSYGLGVMKLGHADAYYEKPGNVLEQLAFLSSKSLDLEGSPEEFSEEEPSRGRSRDFEPNELVSSPHPFAIRIPTEFFYYDPLSTSLRDARWVCHAVVKPLDELRKSKVYPKSIISGVQGTHTLRTQTAGNEVRGTISRVDPATEADLVLIYEIWDRENRELLVMDDYNMTVGTEAKFLRKDPWPYQMKGFPFECLVFNPDPEYFPGVSDFSQWFNPTSAMNTLTTMQHNHVKRYQRKYLAQQNSLDPEEIAKLQNPIDGAIIFTKGPPRDSVVNLEDATVNPDLYGLRSVLRTEMTFISGATEARQGLDTGTNKTATEVTEIAASARIRDSDRLMRVSKFIEHVAKKLLTIDQQVLTVDYVTNYAGLEGAEYWQNFFDQVINAPVSVQVRVGSSAYVSREVKIKQMLDFMNLGKGQIDPRTGTPVLDPVKIMSRIAEEMNLDGYKEFFYSPGEVPPVMPNRLGGGEGGGNGQSTTLRNGSTDLASQLSAVQNLGVRRAPRSL